MTNEATFKMPESKFEIAVPAHTLQCFDMNTKEVVRIQQDGRIFWNGREVETDDDFRAAMIDLATIMNQNIRPYNGY